MTATNGHGVFCAGLDESFLAEQTRKSNLLLEGRLLDAQAQFDAATEKYAAAAEIEEQLAARCRQTGLREKAWLHHRSAIGCWVQAGNFYTALRLGDQMLAEPDLSDRLRQDVRSFQDTIRARRREWAERAMAREAADAAAPVPA